MDHLCASPSHHYWCWLFAPPPCGFIHSSFLSFLSWYNWVDLFHVKIKFCTRYSLKKYQYFSIFSSEAITVNPYDSELSNTHQEVFCCNLFILKRSQFHSFQNKGDSTSSFLAKDLPKFLKDIVSQKLHNQIFDPSLWFQNLYAQFLEWMDLMTFRS